MLLLRHVGAAITQWKRFRWSTEPSLRVKGSKLTSSGDLGGAPPRSA